MSVSTPSLTTSSEIWAWAAPVRAASARPAAAAVANSFMFSSPGFLLRASVCGAVLAAICRAAKAADSAKWMMKLQAVSGAVSQLRQLAHGDAHGAGRFHDDPQRFGIEGHLRKADIGDIGVDPHAVVALLEIGDRLGDLLLRVGGELLQVDGRLLHQRALEVRHHGPRRGTEQSERCFRLDREFEVVEP